MNTDLLLNKISALEDWLGRTKGRSHLLPLRWAGHALLAAIVLLSTAAALVRWPFGALARRVGTGDRTLESEGTPSAPASQSALPVNEPIAVDGEELGRLIDGNRRVLVDFWAEWCGPCLMMDGLIEEVAESSGRDCLVAKVHAGTHGDVAEAYGVNGLPTFIVFEDGEEVRRHAGTLSRAELEWFVEGGEEGEGS